MGLACFTCKQLGTEEADEDRQLPTTAGSGAVRMRKLTTFRGGEHPGMNPRMVRAPCLQHSQMGTSTYMPGSWQPTSSRKGLIWRCNTFCLALS